MTKDHPLHRPEPGPVTPLDGLRALVGRTFEGDWFAIDRELHSQFERSTYLDVAYPATDSTQLEGIVEGFYLLSLLDALTVSLFRIDPREGFAVNYGLNRARFVRPVLLDDWIRLRCTVTSADQRLSGLVLTLACEILLQRAERPALVADWLLLFRHIDRPLPISPPEFR